MTEQTWILRVAPEPASCRVARTELARFLTPLVDDATTADAQLVLHELVANGVDHARTPMLLTARVRDGAVRLRVRDGCAVPGREQPFDPAALRGRGLQIVGRLSRRWGVRRHRGGKTTWADLGVARDRPAADLARDRPAADLQLVRGG
ncbi:ATP-binding protein [Pseudonocardia spirodelae]|uniref:ATP-binding protein n=1 Tax=Pseudonocardia spirodelae TaxID=3133431 RepID=A0ABU8T728_9PSEU